MAQKKLPKKVKQEVSRYVLRLEKEKLPIEKVIVYGSYAKGTAREDSDIDLCIVSKRFKKPLDALSYLWALRPKRHDIRIEPIGLHPNDFSDQYDTLVQEIKKTGIEYR